MMSFKDENELSSFVSYLYKKEDKANWLNAFEKEARFNSLRSFYIDQLDYINDILNKNEGDEEKIIYKFVNDNSSYWRIDDRDSENVELVQNYGYGNYYLVANKNLQYLVGGELRTVPKFLNDGVKFIRENEFSKSAGTCGLPKQQVEDIGLKNEKWCKNDRRVKLRTTIGSSFESSSGIDAGYNTFSRGQRKRSCIWVNYKTDLDVFDSSANLIITMPNGTPLIEDPQTNGLLVIGNFSDNNVYNIETVILHFYAKPIGQTADIDRDNDINFEMVQAQAESRGTNGNRAIIDCEAN